MKIGRASNGRSLLLNRRRKPPRPTDPPVSGNPGVIQVGGGGGDPALEEHLLADTSGLGDQHTVEGLTAGQVLKATGAESAAFDALNFSELEGTLQAGQHGDLADGDHTGNLTGNARVGVRKNSTGSTHTRRRLNLIEGSGIGITIADDSGDEEVDVTLTATGGSAADQPSALLGAWYIADASAIATDPGTEGNLVGFPSAVQTGIRLPHAGRITGVSIAAASDLGAAGVSVTATVYSAGVATAAAATLDGGAGTEVHATAEAAVDVNAHQELTVYVERSGAPNAVAVVVYVYGWLGGVAEPAGTTLAYGGEIDTDSGGLGSGTTLTLNVGSGIAAGSRVMVSVGVESGTSISSITDSRGNTYDQHVSRAAAGGHALAIWSSYLATALQVGDTITITFSSSTGPFAAHGCWFAGTQSGGVDQGANAGGTSTTPNSGNVTLSEANEALLGLIVPDFVYGSFTPDAGWTALTTVSIAGWTLIPMYQIASSTGPHAASGTFGASGAWDALIATYGEA